MKHYELLRECADRLERDPDKRGWALGMVLHHPFGGGKFPFTGGGTEKLSQTQTGNNYYVPVHRILAGLGKALKEDAK